MDVAGHTPSPEYTEDAVPSDSKQLTPTIPLKKYGLWKVLKYFADVNFADSFSQK